jgi:Outer membrane protein beta-barrel domain
MNKPRRSRFTAIALFALACLPVHAQRYEIGPYFAFDRMSRKPQGTVRQSGGADTDTRFGDGKGLGLRVTLNTKGYYGHEVSFVRSQIPLTSNVDAYVFNSDGSITLGGAIDRREKVRQTRLGYNFLMYMMPAGEWWRPYVTVGISSIRTNPPRFLEWTSIGNRNFAANFGGGIKLQPVKHFLFRLDFREIIVGRPYTLSFPNQSKQGNLRQMEISSGISFAFGK